MSLSRYTSLLPALIIAVGVAGASGAQNRNQPATPIFELTAVDGLSGGGTGREVSIGIAQEGVTTTHIADGTITLDDLSATTVSALQPSPQVRHLGEGGDIPLIRCS